MAELTDLQWALIAAAAAVYLITCLRVALAVRHIGRRPIVWFFITLFFTAIPATIAFARYRFRALRPRGTAGGSSEASGEGPRRCPHCQAVLTPAPAAGADGLTKCPACGQAIAEEHLS
jgi:uncharacterized paraquat-inducible protein A